MLPEDWQRVPALESVKDLGTEWQGEGRSPVLEVPSALIPQESTYCGHYSNVARARRMADSPSVALPGPGETETTEPEAAERRRLRRLWATLIRRIDEIDPLACTDYGGEMRVVSFVLDPAVVRKILDHLGDSHLPPVRVGLHGSARSMPSRVPT